MTRFAHPCGLPSTGRTLWPTAIAALFIALGSAASASPFQCGEDNLENNDTCGTARAIATPFSAAGLAVYKTDNDYYSVSVPPGEEIQIDIFFTHLIADVDLFLYDQNGPCGGLLTYLSRSDSSSNDESVNWLNTGSSTVDVAIKVLIFPGSITQCNNYDMQVTVGVPIDPCDAMVSDDQFEDNDVCMAAYPAQIGVTPDLWVSRDDPDFWSFTVQPGEAVDAQIYFSDVASDLDIFLYDAAGPCGMGFGTGELASGFTQTDNERIIWTNTGSTARNLILQVYVFVSGSCNNYDLDIDIAGGGLGTNYCLAVPNSTGVIGLISAAGTTSMAMNDLRLSAKQLPLNTFGFFLNSRMQAFVPNPGGSDGNLCLGGAIGRYSLMIQSSGGGGRIAISLDLTDMPQPSGAISAAAGQTWFFQAWHRDSNSSGATSNFTNGIMITLTN